MILSHLHQAAHSNPLRTGIVAGILAVLSAVLILAHIHTIETVRDTTVPLLGQLPKLERKAQLLQEQLELTELSSVARTGSRSEKVAVYALPEKTDIARTVATFEVIRDVLKRDHLLASMSDIALGDPLRQADGSTVRTLSVEMKLHEDGVRILTLLLHLSGLLTVGDVLTTQEVDALVAQIEQDNPSGITALEQFLSADLLHYAKDPKSYEEQLKRSFSTASLLSAFDTLLWTSLLRDVQHLLRGDMGEALDAYKLWPLQLMVVDNLRMEAGSAPGWYTVQLQLSVLSREG